MKFPVALFFLLAVFGSVVIAQRQPQRQNKSAVTKSPSQTIRICQGIPVPDGYVIIAYMTSTACPHGAYLLQKQNSYESSLAVNGGTRQNSDDSAESSNEAGARPSRMQPRNRIASGQGRTAIPAARTSRDSQSSASQPSAVSVTASRVSASATRPRRVGAQPPAAAQSQEGVQTQVAAQTSGSQSSGAPQSRADDTVAQVPPSLIGSEAARASGPPKLIAKGAIPDSATTDSLNTVVPSGPEEVGEGDVLRVNTSLVAVPVSVLDKQGRFVANLQKEDFRIFENGIEQSIAYFEPADKPFTVALLLDTSASTHFHLEDIREAAIAFAKQLRPQDRVLIVSFNDEVLLLTEVTNDLNLIETVIEENANTGNSTRLYDAVDLTIRERLNKIKGRKAIVLFTDGVDTSSQQATYESTLRQVEELDALIYPVQYDTSDYMRAMQNNGAITVTTTTSGVFGSRTTTQTYNAPVNGGAPLPGSTKADYDRADKYLHALAYETGGRLYQANDTTQLADAFTRIAEELRRQYSLGYYPKNDSSDGNERREIKVRVRQSNLAVKARDSYMKSSTATPQQ